MGVAHRQLEKPKFPQRKSSPECATSKTDILQSARSTGRRIEVLQTWGRKGDQDDPCWRDLDSNIWRLKDQQYAPKEVSA